jgi:hypothetical protein
VYWLGHSVVIYKKVCKNRVRSDVSASNSLNVPKIRFLFITRYSSEIANAAFELIWLVDLRIVKIGGILLKFELPSISIVFINAVVTLPMTSRRTQSLRPFTQWFLRPHNNWGSLKNESDTFDMLTNWKIYKPICKQSFLQKWQSWKKVFTFFPG